MASFSGSPPTSSLQGYTPWFRPPGANFSDLLYSYMSTLIGQPAPRYGGFGAMDRIGQQKNPFLNDQTQLAQNFWNLGLPSIFGTGISSLSRFLNPSFSNPVARLQMGGAPNYFGPNTIPSPNAGDGIPPMQPMTNPFIPNPHGAS